MVTLIIQVHVRHANRLVLLVQHQPIIAFPVLMAFIMIALPTNALILVPLNTIVTILLILARLVHQAVWTAKITQLLVLLVIMTNFSQEHLVFHLVILGSIKIHSLMNAKLVA